MYSQTDLNEAVAAGAITEEQANSLRSFVATRNGAPTGDEEHFRLLSGFNDILCFIACGFALVAVGWLGTLIPLGPSGYMARAMPVSAPFAALFVAAASWGLAELFTKRRPQWLTSILLIVGATWGPALFLLLLILSGGGMDPNTATLVGALCFLLGGGAAFLHWRRYRLPIAIATMYGFGVLALVSLMATSMMRGSETLMIVLLIAGIGAFFYAMWWDGQDPLRHNEKSEAGFWLHWLAAGLIVNALATLFGVNQGIESVGGAIGVILIFLILAVIGLAVNRRAYALTAISPLVIAIQTLLGEGRRRSYYDYDRYGANPYGGAYNPYGSPYGSPYSSYRPPVSAEGTMLTILIIGVILLLLAIYWAPLRRVLVGMLPEGLRARLPPTSTVAQEQANTFE